MKIGFWQKILYFIVIREPLNGCLIVSNDLQVVLQMKPLVL